MTIVLSIWLSVLPGRWAVGEIPMESMPECESAVRLVAKVARIFAHEFVIRCEERK